MCDSHLLRREIKCWKASVLWDVLLCAAANKMDAVLCRGFICTAESFVGNMAGTEIIVDATLYYFHGLQLTYVAE